MTRRVDNAAAEPQRGRLSGRIFGAQTLIVGGLCVIVLLIYLNSFSNDFTNWDDDNGIINNPYIRSLAWENLTKIFTPGTGGAYQPLRTLSLAVDHHFWGLNPFGYHLTNVFFYVLTCIMVFLTTEKLLAVLREDRDDVSKVRVALFASLLFAVHPVHVEAVTWLSARKEVLLGFFFFLSFYLYLRAKDSGRLDHKILCYSLAFFGFLAATLSKPTAVVLPLILILFEFYARRSGEGSFSLKKALLYLPFIILSLYLGYLLIDVMRDIGGIKAYRGGTFFSNLLLVPYLYIRNIKLLAFTINYAAVYTIHPPQALWSAKTVLPLLGNMVILGCAALTFKKARIVSFAILWFYITLLPVSNIVPISTILADRYAFLPSYGWCLVLGIALERLYRFRLSSTTPQFFKALSVSGLSLMVLGYGYMTVYQNRIWKNTYTLWADAVAKQPDNHIALCGLAVVYNRAEEYEAARKLLERAVSNAPHDYKSLNNLGITYFHLGQRDKAFRAYQKALSLDPYMREAHVNLARLYVETKDYKAAESVYLHFLEKHGNDANMHYLLGELYRRMEQFAQAKSRYEIAVALAPNVSTPYEALGRLYLDHLKDREKALFYLQRALEIAKGSKRAEEIKALIDSLRAVSASVRQGAGENNPSER